MTNSPIKVLTGLQDAAFLEELKSISNRLHLVGGADLKENPELLQEIEVAFGVLNPEQVAAASRLRWFQSMGAGVNGLLTDAVLKRDVTITNASGIHAEPITEHMFGMLLMLTRRLGEARDQQKGCQWRGYDFGSNVLMLSGKTLGVLGVGAIGAHSARVGRAFGMTVLGLRRSRRDHPDVERMYGEGEKLDFLSQCDVVMNSLPLSAHTRHFMDAEAFAAMKEDAVVINTGRGATIDTAALVDALSQNRLGAALLDVTEPEPLPAEHPLWSMPNVFITPHYSGAHPDYNRRAGAIFLKNVRLYLEGKPLFNVVDKAAGY